MRASTLFIIILAILLGLGTATLVKVSGILRPAVAAPAPEASTPLPNVLVASRNIFEGNFILPSWVKVRAMSAEEAADYKRNKSAYLPPVANAAVERVSACNIEADKPILRQYLREMAKPDSLHLRLLRSMRAVNVTLPRENTAGGLIQVGEWVDVYLTSAITGPDASAGARVVTNRTANLCCDARVIAKRNTLWPLFGNTPENAPVHFTLEVDPYRAALINYARDKGVLTLVPLPAAEQRTLETRRNQFRAADLGVQEELLTLSGHKQWVRALAFSADGKRLITVASTPAAAQSVGSTSRLELKIWDASDGRMLNSLVGPDMPVGTMMLSPDGRSLAFSSNNDVHIYDTATVHEQALLPGSEFVRAIRYSPEGDLLGIAYAKSVKLVDLATKAELGILKDTPAVPTIGFARGRRLVALGGAAGVDVYDLKTQQLLQQLDSGSGAVTHLNFSPDGRWLAAGTKAGAIRIWEAQSGKKFMDLHGHNGIITSLAFSPDSKLLASGSADTTIRISEIHSGADLAVLHGHSDSVRAVAFSPDGGRLASSSQDKTCRVWRVPVEDSKESDPIVFCEGNGEEYRDEVDRIRAFQRGDLTVGERDLMRVFNLQLPPAPVPNVSVEQFAGLTRRGNVVFGTNGDMMPQPADHARHAMSGNEHADSTFIFSIPAGLAQASERANPTRSNRPTQINPAASRPRSTAGASSGTGGR